MMRRLACLLISCWLGMAALATPAVAGLPPLEIAPEAQRVPAFPALRVVAPADRDLSPDQAALLAAGSDAMSVDSPDRIFGRGSSPFWASFSLANPSTSVLMRLVSVETTTQSDMRLFEQTASGEWRRITSLAEAADGRIGGGTTHPVWTLHLEPRQTTKLLLRIEGPAIVRFPVFIYHPVKFAERERNINVAIGIALGSCLFIVVYTAWLRRYLNDALVPLFIYMIVADMVGALWLSGFLSELLPAVPESVLSPIGFAAYATLFGCGSLHARTYLNCAAWAPKCDTLLRILGWSWLALAPFFALTFPIASRILLVWGGAFVAALLVVVSTLAVRNKILFSKYIGAAWLAYLIGGLFFLLARISENPLLWSWSPSVLLQATVVAACFGFAMSQRMMQQRDALVAARRDAEMQKERGEALMRERSLLFAATNHDLRQPLLGVGLFANLLKSATTPEEREDRWRKLDMALKEVDELLLGIQQLAAVHEAEHSPAMDRVKLDDLLAPVVEEYRGRAEYKRITIRYVPSSFVITTHIPYFQRIVRNVLSNAIRYTEQGDRILVGCRRGGGLRLVILDTGRGMTEDQISRAFNPFQRFDDGMSIPDGFGLGLFSTRSLADSLGLAVSLKSRAGRGTEFSITLPSPAAADGC